MLMEFVFLSMFVGEIKILELMIILMIRVILLSRVIFFLRLIDLLFLIVGRVFLLVFLLLWLLVRGCIVVVFFVFEVMEVKLKGRGYKGFYFYYNIEVFFRFLLNKIYI